MIFAPKYIKESHQIVKNVERLLHYKRDILRPADLETLRSLNRRLHDLTQQRDRPAIEKTTAELDAAVSKLVPATKNHGWAENCETFLVAIIIALAIRAYFLQPFKIPTGSMQPTLNGVIPIKDSTPPPGLVQRIWEKVWNGRSYVYRIAERDDQIVRVEEKPFLWFSTSTQITMRSGASFKVPCAAYPAQVNLNLGMGRMFNAGETIVQAHIDTGDQVFVDKLTYHFRKPHRADVFVFTTNGIEGIMNDPRSNGNTQFYIKRLGGLPGDTLRIAPPTLFTNGEVAREWQFKRVIAAQNGYEGYGNIGSMLLAEPEQSFDVPPGDYVALGDNSLHSSDSRTWGPVPEKNIVGRGLFVYWPFGQHFGLVR